MATKWTSPPGRAQSQPGGQLASPARVKDIPTAIALITSRGKLARVQIPPSLDFNASNEPLQCSASLVFAYLDFFFKWIGSWISLADVLTVDGATGVLIGCCI